LLKVPLRAVGALGLCAVVMFMAGFVIWVIFSGEFFPFALIELRFDNLPPNRWKNPFKLAI